MESDELKALIEAGIIDENKAKQIASFLETRGAEKPSRIFLVFAIIGAILIGVGIFSIMAFNWSSFSLTSKTIVAFTPLLIAQGLCIYTLAKKENNALWYESVGTILIFAFGGALILISELYTTTVQGDQFILVWILLSIPIIYLLQSSMASILSIIGITFYAVNTNSFASSNLQISSYLFIPFLLSITPFYYALLKQKSAANFTLIHGVVFWNCLLICLTTFCNPFGRMIPFTFLFLGNLVLILSHQKLFLRRKNDSKNNVLFYLSILGIFIAVVFYSFHDNWNTRSFKAYDNWIFFIFLILCAFSLGIIIKEKFLDLKKYPLLYIFIPSLLALFLGKNFPLLAVIIFNILGLLMGLYFILDGNNKNHLGILNIGLLMVLIMILSRAMDIDINESWKGVIFVLLGLGFFLVNYVMIKKRKEL